MNNKWIRAAIPALLIHCSIGTVYCWSTFKEAIAEQIGVSTFATGWAFSFAIFFLGMSAAFAGELVEKDIHKSSFISAICFSMGLIGTGASIQYLHGIPALIGIYLFYGFLMGIGLGIGYITPVKTLMLWFDKQKGLATGISIMGFGLAKAIATPIMERLQQAYDVSMMFYILGMVYFFMMFLGHLLLRKPAWWKENDHGKVNFKAVSLLKKKKYILIWLMFFLNIHCGLMLITYEKQFVRSTFGEFAALAVMLIPSLTAACNALGRIGYSTLSDKLKDRTVVYNVIFSTSQLVSVITYAIMRFSVGHLASMIWVVLLLMVINLGYGGGFSTLPALLSQEFGMNNISKIHGITLTAWAVAGITGNNLSEMILRSNGENYKGLLVITSILYLVAFYCSLVVMNEKE